MNVKKSLTLFHKRNSDVLSTPKSPSVCGVNNLRRSNSLPIISNNNLYLDWKTKCTNKCSSTSFPKGQLRQIDYLNPMCLVCFSPLNVAFKNKSFEDVQAEVEALIEFKHVVLQTFPEIRSKIPMNSTVSSRRHISNNKQIQGKSKKTLDIPENLPINAVKVLEDALQSLTSYSRSYSNCCRREPKSGEGSGGLIQDSGFSTETSSKDCCSALAFPGGLQVINNTSNQHVFGTDDELFNLLDVVFRKTSKQSDDLNTSSACIVNMFCSNTTAKQVGRFVSNLTLKQNLLKINKERDNLLLKVAEMESELVKNQIIISKMAEKLKFFVSERRTLKDQLKKQNFALGLNQHICDSREIKGTPSKGTAKFQREMLSQLQCETCLPRKISEDDKKCSSVISKTIIDESARSQLTIGEFESSHTKFNQTPGSNSSRHPQTHDSTAIAAILLETNSLELQRQLLTLAVANKVERITPEPFETEIKLQRCLQTNSSKPSICQVSNSPSYMYDNADKPITQPFVIENANTNYKNFEEVSGAVDRQCDKSMSLTDWENDKKIIKRLKPSKIPLYSSITLGSSNSEKTYNTSKDKKLHTSETKSSIDTTSNSLGVFKRRNKTKMPTAVVNAKTTLPDSIFLTPSLPRHKRIVPTGAIVKLDSYEKCKKVSNSTGYEKSNLERHANSINQNSCSVPPVTNFNRNAEQKDDISNLHLKATETELEGESIEQSVQTNVQLLVGGINKNSYRTSILNSMNHIRIQDDEIGRVRNLRSTLLGWLKI